MLHSETVLPGTLDLLKKIQAIPEQVLSVGIFVRVEGVDLFR